MTDNTTVQMEFKGILLKTYGHKGTQWKSPETRVYIVPKPVGLSWLQHRPIKRRAVGLIPSQGKRLGCRSSPQLGCVGEATGQCFSLTSTFLSLPFHSPLSKLGGHVLGAGSTSDLH